MAASNTTTNYGFNLTDFDAIPWHTEEHNNWHILDAVLARFVAVSSVKGAWENALAVVVGDRYIDVDEDQLYEVLVAHTTPSTGLFSASRTANATYWQSISVDVTAKGAYAQNTTYNPNDFVIDGVRYGVGQTSFTSDNDAATTALSYDADVAAGNIVTLIDGDDILDLQFTANGMLARTAAGSYTSRTLLGGTGIDMTNGDGISDAPSIAIDSTVVTLTGSQTLTSKTLTAPTINGVIGGTTTSQTITTLTATDVNSTNLDGILGADTARAISGTTGSFSGIVTGAAPSSGGDLTNKTYVDGLIAGLGKRGTVTFTDTGSNVIIANELENGDSFDGDTLATGDTILLRNQTNTYENGVYDVPASGAATRNEFFDTYDEHPGSLIHVQKGSAGADLLYHCTSNVGGTLDTTAITWVNIVPGSGGTVTNVATSGLATGGAITTTGTVDVAAAIGTEVITGTETTKAMTPDAYGDATQKGGDIASASPLVIGTDGRYFDVTGTTSFAAMTVAANRLFFLQFDDALTITHGASLKLPGGANLTTAAGDVWTCYSTLANTVIVTNVATAAAAAGGTWVLISTSVASTSATLDVTGLDSTYDTYYVIGSDLVPVTDDVEAWIRLGDSGGIDSAASDYNAGTVTKKNDTGAIYYENDTAASALIISTEQTESIGNAAGEGISFVAKILTPGDSTQKTKMSWEGHITTNNGASTPIFGAGQRASVITCDRVQFLFQSGNISTGRLSVWGVSHA
jgi:hypothetical protein